MLVTEENKVTSNVGCVSAEFAQRETSNMHWESLALVSRFERARSHDVNDPTHSLIQILYIYSRTTLLCRLMNLWNLTEPVKSSTLAQ